MKTRPWPLVVLAGLQILSPVGTVLINSWALGVAPHYVIGFLLEAKPLRVFESLALMPIAGIAIYLMKPWSYAIFAGAMLWSLGANLSNWSYATQSFSAVGLVLLYLFQFALAFYFLLPSVRRTYFDASMRWWEAKRRYLLAVPVTVTRGAERISAQGLNLSEGGMLIRMPGVSPAKGERLGLSFSVAGVEFQVEGEAVYSKSSADGASEDGIRFLLDEHSGPRFQRLARALELLGVPSRDAETQRPWYLSLGDWALRLVRTGKGWAPEVSPSRPSGERSPERRSN